MHEGQGGTAGGPCGVRLSRLVEAGAATQRVTSDGDGIWLLSPRDRGKSVPVGMGVARSDHEGWRVARLVDAGWDSKVPGLSGRGAR